MRTDWRICIEAVGRVPRAVKLPGVLGVPQIDCGHVGGPLDGNRADEEDDAPAA